MTAVMRSAVAEVVSTLSGCFPSGTDAGVGPLQLLGVAMARWPVQGRPTSQRFACLAEAPSTQRALIELLTASKIWRSKVSRLFIRILQAPIAP